MTPKKLKPEAMGFAILRVAKLTTAGNIGGLNSHLTRTMEVPNADPDLAKYNSRPIGSDDLWHDVQQRIDQSGVKVRKNAVLAVEHLITGSPETFGYHVKETEGKKELYGKISVWKNFESAAKAWLIKRYGEENLVNFTVHLDESTPHIHAVVVPIADGKLNCRGYLGGREKLSEMQTSFAQAVEHIGLQRGIKGSKAKHMEAKQFNGIVEESKKAIQKAVQDVPYTPAPHSIKGFKIPDPPLTGRSKWKEDVQNALNDHIGQMLKDLKGYMEKEEEKKIKAVKENATKSIINDYNGVLEKREAKHLLKKENELKAKYEGKNTMLEGVVKKLQDSLAALGFKYNPKNDTVEPLAGQQEQKPENTRRMKW